jgi:hypothetical protein
MMDALDGRSGVEDGSRDHSQDVLRRPCRQNVKRSTPALFYL